MLTITLHEVLSDVAEELGDDPGLQKDGVEAHLQELLAASPHAIEDGLTLVRREYPTAIGPIDLVCRDESDTVVAVEVKRRGEIDGVEQLTRYIERLKLDSSLGEIRGVFVAQIVKPQAKVLAESRGFRWVEVDYDELRGMKPDDSDCSRFLQDCFKGCSSAADETTWSSFRPTLTSIAPSHRHLLLPNAPRRHRRLHAHPRLHVQLLHLLLPRHLLRRHRLRRRHLLLRRHLRRLALSYQSAIFAIDASPRPVVSPPHRAVPSGYKGPSVGSAAGRNRAGRSARRAVGRSVPEHAVAGWLR